MVNELDLTGTWHAAYAEVNGEMAAHAHVTLIRHIFLQPNRFQVTVGDRVEHEGTYTVNDKVTPHQITFVYNKSSHFELDKPRVGIVQIAGNTSKFCLGAVGAHPPSSFNTAPKSTTSLTILQKKGFEGGTSIKELAVFSDKVSLIW
jgi:uncharacterized protein (TIGR03067 family)